jgi:hypothetical protein
MKVGMDIAGDGAAKAAIRPSLRTEAIPALLSDRKIPAGNAARELGANSIACVESAHG